MQIAKIVGYANGVVKSDELYGAELLVAVPVDMDSMQETGKPFLLADKLGAKEGQIVVYAQVCSFRQDDASISTVVAVPQSITFDGKKRFTQTVKQETDGSVEAEYYEPTVDELDPVSDLTAEFKALHRELARIPDEQQEDQNTNSVPYEQYAKYLTTDFEPVDVPGSAYAEGETHADEDKRKGYSRVGYRRSDKKK